MKYLKLFEGKKNMYYQYKGFRQKQKENLDKIEKYKMYIPGYYIVFEYDFLFNNSIILGRISEVKYLPDDVKKYSQFNDNYYLKIDIIDQVAENLDGHISISNVYDLKAIKPLFITVSSKTANIKFNEFASDLILKRDAKKYNL